jgi:hypothetical protein
MRVVATCPCLANTLALIGPFFMLIVPENLGIQNITSYVTRTQAKFVDVDTGATANIYR